MKIFSMTRLGVLACAVAASGSAHATLLDDGNFDNATSGTLTSGSAWQLIGNMPDGANNSVQFQTGFANAQNTRCPRRHAGPGRR